MRDIVVFALLIACMVLALRKPWYGAIGLTLFDYLNPHRYCWGFMYTMPAYSMLLFVVFLRFLFSGKEDKQPIPKDWRIFAFFFLWAYFLFTTFFAMVPVEAWAKLTEVSKVYLPLILTITLITDRHKLFAMLCAMAGGIGLLALKGGIWAIGSGFSNRVWGPPGTQYGGNNEFAVVNLMMIPILLMIARQLKNKRLATAIRLGIPFCFAAAICSWSRGALLGSVVLVLGILWHSKRKWLVAPIIAGGIVLLIGQLPDAYFGRMHTLETYEEDSSAMSRINAWKDGFDFALHHPLTGAGFEGWLYVTQIDWHNSAVEIMSEHGFLALAVWLSLIIGTMFSLTGLIRMGQQYPQIVWLADYSISIRLSLAIYIVGTMFLGLSYWTVLYQLIFCAVLMKKFAFQELAQLQQPKPLGATDRDYMPPAGRAVMSTRGA